MNAATPMSSSSPIRPNQANSRGGQRMGHILLVDRDREVLSTFRRLFQEPGHQVAHADGFQPAVELVRQRRPDVVVMDVRKGSPEGLEALTRLRQLAPEMPIIVMTTYGTTKTAIDAMKLGATDFVLKPFREFKMQELVTRALEQATVASTDHVYEPTLSEEDFSQELIGRSEAMQAVYKRIGQVAGSDVPVFIAGESGTGKELIAKAIYRNSNRSNRAFLALDCSAAGGLPIESDLFGYEKGAFTGATTRRRGKLELCDGGTLLLEEIGYLSASAQNQLLGFLQTRTVQRLGGTEAQPADVRLLVTSSQPLEELVAQGKFRADLYYRLNVVRIDLPALRDRADDIPILTEYFLRRLEQQGDATLGAARISAGAMELLEKYAWPDNVRQLENLLHSVYVTRAGGTITPGDVEPLLVATPEPVALPINATPLVDAAAAFALSTNGVSSSHGASLPVEPSAARPETSTRPIVRLANGSPDAATIEGSDDVFEGALAVNLEPVFQAVLQRRQRFPHTTPIDIVEKFLVRRALNETQGNQVHAAKMLGMSRATLRKRIERFDLVIERRVR